MQYWKVETQCIRAADFRIIVNLALVIKCLLIKSPGKSMDAELPPDVIDAYIAEGST